MNVISGMIAILYLEARYWPAPGRVPGMNGQTFRVYEPGWWGSKAENMTVVG
jgi:hypothetical protein